jgi:hypothetical protein
MGHSQVKKAQLNQSLGLSILQYWKVVAVAASGNPVPGSSSANSPSQFPPATTTATAATTRDN